jgi:hypothetical protein
MDGILELLGSTSSLRDTLYELVSGSELGGAVQIGRGCARSRGGPDAEEGVAKHADPMLQMLVGSGPEMSIIRLQTTQNSSCLGVWTANSIVHSINTTF